MKVALPFAPFCITAVTLLALVLPVRVEAQGAGAITGYAFDGITSQPMEGARVEALRTTFAATTDAEGRFRLAVPAGTVVLRITHPGYGSVVETFEVTNLEETLIQLPMVPLSVALEELRVEVRRRRALGASDFEERVVRGDDGAATAADLLAQRVPGLSVHRTTGAIGGGASITIRGLNSIAASNAPAIYLDGIRITDRASELRGSRSPQAEHILESIPASNVRQIRVLRGPAASAYFGDSASGVIIIETVDSLEPR